MNAIFTDTTYFQLAQIVEGVYFAQALPGTGTLGNAAIVDLGDRTLIFDTFLTPQAAQALRHAAEQLTGRPASYVVNSHYHADHVMGNQAFLPEAVFVSTARTRQLLVEQNFLDELGEVADDITRLEQELALTTDEARSALLRGQIGDNRALLTAASTLRCVLPTLTFEEKLSFHGSARQAELLCYGGGHTASDAFLYLPAERLAIMGDLVLVRNVPMFVHGDPQTWRGILARVKQLDIQFVLPGHGPVGARTDIDLIDRCLLVCEELAASVYKRGGTLEEARELSLPEPFASWAAQDVFMWNMEAWFKKAGNVK